MMNDLVQAALPPVPTLARWSARLMSAAILLFWGFFIVANLVGNEESAARPLNANDYIIMASLGFSLVGLAAAWKWELAGALLTLAAMVVCAFANWRVVIFPGTLIPLTACLFLLSWWLHRTRVN